MDSNAALAILRANAAELQRRGVRHAALFGSVARGEARPDSDLDVMIDIDARTVGGVFGYVGLCRFIDDLFPIPVDIANRAGLRSGSVNGPSAMPSLPSERERDALLDIVANVQLANDFIGGSTFDAFVADDRTNYAVVRCLEIISEASRWLSAEMRGRHPQVPWRQIAAAGNHYRHGYDGITLDIVWLTVHDELPVLVAAIQAETDRLQDS